jgi:hypothetical protein
VEGISKYSRLRTTAVAALVAAGLLLMAMSGSASANVKRISLGIRNSSKTPIRAQICTNRHIRSGFEAGLMYESPCDTIEGIWDIDPGQRAIIPNANPVGVIIRNIRFNRHSPAHDRTLYFLARSRSYEYGKVHGTPQISYETYFRSWTPSSLEKVFAWPQPVLRDVAGVRVELRRYHDEDRDGENVRLMRIEIRHWPGT